MLYTDHTAKQYGQILQYSLKWKLAFVLTFIYLMCPRRTAMKTLHCSWSYAEKKQISNNVRATQQENLQSDQDDIKMQHIL